MRIQIQKVNPESLAGKALKYAVNEWSFLMNCFSLGDFRIDPFDYLNKVFTNLPKAQTGNDFLELLPIKIAI